LPSQIPLTFEPCPCLGFLGLCQVLLRWIPIVSRG
jgi:hypothetical protein